MYIIETGGYRFLFKYSSVLERDLFVSIFFHLQILSELPSIYVLMQAAYLEEKSVVNKSYRTLCNVFLFTRMCMLITLGILL